MMSPHCWGLLNWFVEVPPKCVCVHLDLAIRSYHHTGHHHWVVLSEALSTVSPIAYISWWSIGGRDRSTDREHSGVEPQKSTQKVWPTFDWLIQPTTTSILLCCYCCYSVHEPQVTICLDSPRNPSTNFASCHVLIYPTNATTTAAQQTRLRMVAKIMTSSFRVAIKCKKS